MKLALARFPLARVLLLIAATAAAPFAIAGGRDQFAAFSKGLEGLQGRFVQKVFDPGGGLKEESSGSVALAAPRQFRWDNEKPFPQLVVADGDHIWIYEPDLEQVTVRNQSYEEQTSPLAVLIDPDELERQFRISEAGERDGLTWLALAPKKPDDAQFKGAQLGFLGASLGGMVIEDALGQRTDIRFSDWRRNPAFKPGTFQFKPPAGTDVVGDVAEGAEVTPLKD